MDPTSAETLKYIAALVTFLVIVKIFELILDIVMAFRSHRSYMSKYFTELEENSKNRIDLLKYKGALKNRLFTEAMDAFKEPFEKNRNGEIDSYELRERYIEIYDKYTNECQAFEIDELQKTLDELYARLLAHLPEL